MKAITLTFLLGLLTFGLSACNTTRGIGQDIEATGEAIEEAAEDTKDKMSNDD